MKGRKSNINDAGISLLELIIAGQYICDRSGWFFCRHLSHPGM